MQILDNVLCTNRFPESPGAGLAIIDGVYQSNGGYFAITGGDASAQLAFNVQGQRSWTREFHVPVGNGILQPGTVGIRFRNYLPGTPATVSAALSERREPAVALTAGGIATPTVSLNFISTTLPAPVNLGPANTWLNILNVNLGPGTWLVTAQAYFLNGAGVACGATARLWDNSAQTFRQTEPGDSGANPIPSGSRQMLGPLTSLITLGAATVISLAVNSTQATGTVLTAPLDNAIGNVATSFDAVQVA